MNKQELYQSFVAIKQDTQTYSEGEREYEINPFVLFNGLLTKHHSKTPKEIDNITTEYQDKILIDGWCEKVKELKQGDYIAKVIGLDIEDIEYLNTKLDSIVWTNNRLVFNPSILLKNIYELQKEYYEIITAYPISKPFSDDIWHYSVLLKRLDNSVYELT